MATKKCPNGHQYDYSIYGDNCPFCPSETKKTTINKIPEIDDQTKPVDDLGGGGGRTVIRTNMGGNRVVGLLVTYSNNPMGSVFNLCEGRNTLGRASTCDIALTTDNKISSEHLVILYREAEDVFWLKDQLSTNGTYVNGNFVSEQIKLKSGDVIVVGATKLIFLAIPSF